MLWLSVLSFCPVYLITLTSQDTYFVLYVNTSQCLKGPRNNSSRWCGTVVVHLAIISTTLMCLHCFFTCLWNNLEGFSAFCIVACFFCMKLVNTGTTLLESEVKTLQYFCLNFWWFLVQWQHTLPPAPKPKLRIYMASGKRYQQWLSSRCRCLLRSNSVHSPYCMHYVFFPSNSHSRWLFCVKGKDYSKLNKISEV